ncbi:MAG: IS630 transposase-related protein [Holosporales bacterium]
MVEFGETMGVSGNSIWNAFERLKITRKKSPYATKNGMNQSVQHFYSQSKKYHPQI